MRIRSVSVTLLLLPGCASGDGATRATVPSSSPTKLEAGSQAAPTLPSTPLPSRAPSSPRPDTAAVFQRLKPDLVRCYEDGKKSVPTMLEGRLTLNASIDGAGKTTCVIPTDDTGLTQEVEDCMSARFAAQTFDEGPASTLSVPVAVRSGTVQLGERKAQGAVLDSVETHRMPDAFEVLESLEPALLACVREAPRTGGPPSIVVGARVGADGRTQCALASASSGALPSKVGDCAADVFRRAKFPPPKGGSGLVLVPVTLGR